MFFTTTPVIMIYVSYYIVLHIMTLYIYIE